MRIAFLGTPEFTLPIIEACARSGELALVVAQPDRPVGRSGKPQSPPSVRWARERGIRAEQPEKVKQGRLKVLIGVDKLLRLLNSADLLKLLGNCFLCKHGFENEIVAMSEDTSIVTGKQQEHECRSSRDLEHVFFL